MYVLWYTCIPEATVTNYYTIGDLKQKKVTLSEFRRPIPGRCMRPLGDTETETVCPDLISVVAFPSALIYQGSLGIMLIRTLPTFSAPLNNLGYTLPFKIFDESHIFPRKITITFYHTA